MASKFLSEDGVRRLWAAIEAKFVDMTELDDIIAELPVGTADMVALTNGEIDAITGFVGPLDGDTDDGDSGDDGDDNTDPNGEDNTDPNEDEPTDQEPEDNP